MFSMRGRSKWLWKLLDLILMISWNSEFIRRMIVASFVWSFARLCNYKDGLIIRIQNSNAHDASKKHIQLGGQLASNRLHKRRSIKQ